MSQGIRSFTLKRGLLLFWTLYFLLVLASNLTDAAQAAGWLSPAFKFVSGNYELVRKVSGIYSTPGWIVVVLFAGVLAVESCCVFGFFRALRNFTSSPDQNWGVIYWAFGAAFLHLSGLNVADELFIDYHTLCIQGAHVSMFSAQLLSLLAIRLLPQE
jgi:hypothetical protein